MLMLNAYLSVERVTQTFLAFSLYATLPKLFAAKHPPGSFQSLNGLRFLAMAWIVLGHTYVLAPIYSEAPALCELDAVSG